MAKHAEHLDELPKDVQPELGSTQLLDAYIERFGAAGGQDKQIAADLDMRANALSMIRKKIPLSRILELSRLLSLTRQESMELMNARLMELHGEQATIDVVAIAVWAEWITQLPADIQFLADAYREAAAPSPRIVAGLFEDPAARADVTAVLHKHAQVRLRAEADEAAIR